MTRRQKYIIPFVRDGWTVGQTITFGTIDGRDHRAVITAINRRAGLTLVQERPRRKK